MNYIVDGKKQWIQHCSGLNRGGHKVNTDVLIIGGGVVGTAIARELSHYKLNIVLVEKKADVACGTSKANSGIIHAGYNADTATLKGWLNVKSNPLFDDICEKLNVPFKRIGSLVVGFNKNDLKIIKEKEYNGKSMGLEGTKIIKGKTLFKMEPALNKKARYALYAPTAGIISPYELTIAFADNAVINGVKIMLNTELRDLIQEGAYLKGVKTNRGIIKARVVINAAGVFADEIAKMAKDKIKIRARKGEYFLYDKGYGDLANHILFPVPADNSKGILVTPTVHNNLLIGPNSYYSDDKKDLSTSRNGLKEVLKGARRLLPKLPADNIITSFSGLRATAESEDFIIGYSENIKGLINVAGIQSPGLSSVPAIAKKVKELLIDYIQREPLGLSIEENNDFQEGLSEYPHYYNYKDKKNEWEKLVEKNRDYGEVICRCESVSKGEIIDAIHRPVKARTVDAIKRRTRAGMGRCQGGFCGPRVVELIASELNISPLEVSKKGNSSNILVVKSKGLIKNLEKDEKKGQVKGA